MEQIILEVGLALGLVAAAGLLAARLRLSIMPLLILTGMAVGPHLPHFGAVDLRFDGSAPLIDLLGRLGVLFLLFYLGLEFSVSRLLQAGRAIATGGAIYLAINFSLGLLLPYLLGWPLREILVAAGITAISSSAIVARTVVELRRSANPETELILGIILIEDLFLALYLSAVSGWVLTGATTTRGVLISTGVALGFLMTLLICGRRLVPRLDRWLRIRSDEIFLLVLLAILTLVAGLSALLHLADAIGALLVGLVLAETAHAGRIARLLSPFRDCFGALFFFAFGLRLDPLTLGGAVGPALAAVALTLIGNLTAGMLSGRVAGLSPRAAANIGLTVVARGEFSIVMANLAGAGGLMPVLQPFAALYVLVLAILGPLLSRYSRPLFALFSRQYPGPSGGRYRPRPGPGS